MSEYIPINLLIQTNWTQKNVWRNILDTYIWIYLLHSVPNDSSSYLRDIRPGYQRTVFGFIWKIWSCCLTCLLFNVPLVLAQFTIHPPMLFAERPIYFCHDLKSHFLSQSVMSKIASFATTNIRFIQLLQTSICFIASFLKLIAKIWTWFVFTRPIHVHTLD